jgi:hypothetical protein
MPMNYISSIWGASPDDLWAIGAGGTNYDRLLHYDGVSWDTYSNEVINCLGRTLFGFSHDNIWMGGQADWPDSGGAIWHYNGHEWYKYFIYTVEDNFNAIFIYDIWGASPEDVYACGLITIPNGTSENLRGFVLHFDGNKWSELVRADFTSQFLRINKEKDNIYIFSLGNDFDTGDDDVEFYMIDNDTLKNIYSNKESEIYWAGMTNINGKEYFAINNDVYTYENGAFNKFLSIDYDNFYTKVFGRNEKDIFFLMADGFVHYNGTDMEYIYTLPSNSLRFMGEPLVIENHIYHCLRCDGYNEYIIHGKLEE